MRVRASCIIMAQGGSARCDRPRGGRRAGARGARLAIAATLGLLWISPLGCRTEDPGKEGTNLTPTTLSYADSARFAEGAPAHGGGADRRPRRAGHDRAAGACARSRATSSSPRTCARRPTATRPLPIGYDQTISQPYIVALMTEAAGARGAARRCSRSAPAPATRRPCSPRSPDRSTRIEIVARAGRARPAPALDRAGLPERRRCAPATATAAGPRRRRSTPSSSPPRRTTCRSRCSSSSPSAAAW